jgi:CspA family cold shock protein
MRTGTVKWFSPKKGFGFIRDHAGGPDVFFHYSAIEMEGYKTVDGDQMVQYESEETRFGFKATKVVPMAAKLAA